MNFTLFLHFRVVMKEIYLINFYWTLKSDQNIIFMSTQKCINK